jgi:hypothetical protein
MLRKCFPCFFKSESDESTTFTSYPNGMTSRTYKDKGGDSRTYNSNGTSSRTFVDKDGSSRTYNSDGSRSYTFKR